MPHLRDVPRASWWSHQEWCQSSCSGAWWHLITGQSKLSNSKNTCLLLSHCCVCLEALKGVGCSWVLMRITGRLSHVPLLGFSSERSTTVCGWGPVLQPQQPWISEGCLAVGRTGVPWTGLCKDSNVCLQFSYPLESFQTFFFSLYMYGPLKCCPHLPGRRDLAGICSAAGVEREQILIKTLGQVLVSEMCQIFKAHSE